MSKTINATEKDFESLVLKSDKPVLVDFWASWCGPCQFMGPILEKISEELADKMTVVKVNVDDPGNLKLARQYDIMNIPNMKLFKDGKVVKEVIGAREKDDLLSEINPFINANNKN
jgi:thioredoxin 1